MPLPRLPLLWQIKQSFFDRDAVVDRLQKGWRRRAQRWGSWTRLAARHSMRRRKGPSHPGKPPHVHSGQLRDLLYYAWEPGAGWGNVIVGPVGLRYATPDVPAMHEYGGRLRVTKRGKRTLLRYPARPYMRAAAAYAHDKFWRTYREVWT